jgi:putative restriction endonuclease
LFADERRRGLAWQAAENSLRGKPKDTYSLLVMPRTNWTRSETLVAFNVYCRTPFGRLHQTNPEIIAVAAKLGRTPSALAMKCCNLASLDRAQQQRGISGLTKTSRLDSEVWHAFLAHPEEISYEAEQAFAELMQQPVRLDPDVRWDDVAGLDRQATTKVRVNQRFFRSLILASYGNRCAICELPIPPLLVASHIVPWSVDRSLRMNPHNGICLCSLHDRAFDTGILRIAPSYEISIQLEVDDESTSIDNFLLQYSGRTIQMPDRWAPDPTLLAQSGR